ncbi:hypothetical protein PRIC1_013807 [Phytophthora ramorum]|uniref:Uncharacterized protein n=1 Tax=Phytophthora ramorum TaxID=164328 RepID=H3GT29_PHYRM|nr:hypothetical protein KRP23_10468 [Phytophthora ramorum]KAH7496716.1 hypothetical protein KRP22_13272 [Phytophthora ramorum]
MPRAKDAHVTFQSPSKSPASPTYMFHSKPPPRHCCPEPPAVDAEGLVHALLRVTLKLVVFHWSNSMLGGAAFVVVGCGALLSFVLTPLCGLGLVLFRLVLCLVALLSELDVVLANFVSLPEEHISIKRLSSGSHASPRACGETSVERLVPELDTFSPQALRATLYFVSVKALIGTLSSLVLSIAFSLPVGAISRGSLGDNFHGVVGLLVFLLATTLLLGIGIPLMQYGARLSRAATVYFCCEKCAPEHHHHGEQGHSATYGSTDMYAAA